MEKATFAGGCFWCMVKPFDSYDGIESVISGYTGGHVVNPTYEQVCSNTTGHYEAIQITFDPSIFSYERLLEIFWMNIDPTDDSGQFFDRGTSYQTAIFYHTEEQREKAEISKANLDASNKFSSNVTTKILPAQVFYAAESYHQDYYKKNPTHYNRYFIGSGRAAYIEKMWGDKNER
ncbi:peptide-methionine (S)-S-oxide reductase MsrA [Psychrobacillus vulpis]|uniref:Peptide methionine sulfoxide reductase MsrA n=1 Tax=Psychrobacillus vulpis TaxID=2325572 RepID=A0A544TTD0_9BACI|nr:peptide-methionine (S)-S-oxide reductase MsrA [Psychrobacillus vulpis]TQR20699.1 peptide-methionine (S)-S-oxide reductase MsrA [Psychrobacillus vulpis]